MDDGQRKKIPMTTLKKEEQREKKDPSHIYDRREKVHDNKRRREKKERER